MPDDPDALGTVYDFSAAITVPFRYKVPGPPDNPAPRVIEVDTDRAGYDLHQKLPQLFAPTGEIEGVGDASRQLYGLDKLFAALMKNEPLPECLPQMGYIESIIREVLQVPPYLLAGTVFGVLGAFVIENSKRNSQKKSGPNSPDSPASTPEASSSNASPSKPS